jgi:SNF2 family DNA or RNA helicase
MEAKPIYFKEHLIVEADPRLHIMVPHAKTFVHEGRECMLIPHKVDETQVLRNLGYDVRPPVLMSYDWPSPPGTQPFDAQRITAALITTNRRSFVLNSIGTGKTRSLLYAYDFLKKTTPNYGRMLVTAPLSTLRQTWQREVSLVFPHLRCNVLHGDKKKRLRLLDEDVDIHIINHDGVETIIDELVERLGMFSMVGLDELSVYKNAKTDLWKCTYRFVGEVDRVCGMTATPMTKDASDAYGQIKMLTPAVLGGQSFTRFRETVMNKYGPYRWVNKRDALDTVHKLMQPAVRFTRDECYDLPPCTTVMRETPMTPTQHRAFKHMQDEAAIEHLGVKAANAADQANKCLQIALGFVYDQNHQPIAFETKGRGKLLEEAIAESNAKVIVFTPYKASLEWLVKQLSAHWSVAYVSGDVTPSQREVIFSNFMHAPDPHVLVAHPECMSHGLTLTEASTIVWWGPPQSLETYEQANGRITRAGQRHAQMIVQLVSSKLEQQLFRVLDRRGNVQQVLLDMFERQDKGDLS